MERPSAVETQPITPAKTPARWLGYGLDVLLVLFFAAIAAVGARALQSKVDLRLDDHRTGDDVYFNADVPRVFNHMTDRKSNHFRIKVHPLFLIVAYPPTLAVERLAHVPPEQAVRMVIAGAAAVWTIMIFCILRVSGSPRLDAVVFTFLALSSATAIFWFAVPETYTFGGISLMVPLLLLAVARYRRMPWWTYVAASAVSLSMTVTNWMTGVLAAMFGLPPRKAVRATIYAFYAVVTVWGVEQSIFKDTPFFLDYTIERHEVLRHEWGGPSHNFRSAIFSGFVAPEIKAIGMPANRATKEPARPDYKLLTFQLSKPGSATPWGIVVAVGWVALLVAGLIALIFSKEPPAFRAALGLALVGQLALHTVYGEEAFLYSLHYMPLLILVAAYAARTKARPVVLALAVCLIVGAATNNFRQFKSLTAAVHDHCDKHQFDPEPDSV